ncbi:putative ATPase [Ereboglobus sp. PH5-10]|uniref:AAA family ATPase n=1 Tax=Ereboglobus sp. PH5-10 TaxID=2940629 RepID=UPI002404D910|nr:AAA family ATPase [Ereboglobus sp. PH5-10]MDF9826370.1 putative ATPase [Ereboglobus sp. PH5-10]
MKLTSCRVQNYRSITDSGWVDIDDIAVIVGKNESGKTSFLKALWKFNPFDETEYNIDREWPRGRRKEKSSNKVVVETKFEFSPDEIAQIEGVHESAKGITGVEIARTYAGDYTHNFTPKNPTNEHSVKWVVDLIRNKLPETPQGITEHFQNQYTTKREELIDSLKEADGSSRALEKLPEFKNTLSRLKHPQPPYNQQDQKGVSLLSEIIDSLITEIEATPLLRAVDVVHEIMPTFIYMDDHRAFAGSAQLDEILKHKNEGRLSPDEETIIIIMEKSGLSLEEEVEKGEADDREQRILDMNDASATLTTLIAERWSQKRYEVMFQADGQHFITFVKDVNDKGLIPLEERSKGFQWFFSFDMRFMHETEGNFKNAIILLDEPGLHLHAAAQRDLLERMRAYANGNQLFYTTHLPFMIDFKRLDNIYIAEEKPKEGSRIHKDWALADKDARFTLQAALGLSWSQSLFVGQFNLIVEGVDDFWVLTTFSTMFEDAGQQGIDQRLVITPAGGASKVAYVGTILKGQELNVAVLLDSDTAGEQAFEQLVHQWILKDKLVVMVGDAIGIKPCALEDLFGEEYYLEKINESYAKERDKRVIALDPKTAGKKSIVDRVGDAFAKLKLGEYNKGRVAKRIITDLGKKSLAEVDADTVGKFRKVIDAINGVVASWK